MAVAPEKDIKRLRAQLDEHLAKDKLEAALSDFAALEKLEPKASRWPHKRGDVLRRMGRNADAVAAYERAARCYVAEGFVARAVAIAKTVLMLDPSRTDVLERVDPDAAKPADTTGGSTSQASMPAATRTTGERPAPQRVGSRGAPPRAKMTLQGVAAPAPTPAVRPTPAAQPAPEPAPKPAPVVERVVEPVASTPPLPRPPRAPKISSTSFAVVDASVPTDRPLAPARERPARKQPPALPPRRNVLRGPPPLPKNAAPSPLDDSALMSHAEQLVRDPKAASDEVRFSDLPPRPSDSIPVSAVELRERHSLPPSAPKMVTSATPADLSKLPLFPLFTELPREALKTLVQASTLVELPHGKHVIRRGEESDCLYGIIEGSVQLQPLGAPASQYMALAEGDVFGESCLLRDEPRHVDVVVQGNLTALRMPKDALMSLVKQHRQVGEVLLELLTRRLIANLLSGSHLFAGIDTHSRAELAAMFEVRRAPLGTVLMEGGKRGDGLYIALTGRILCKLPGVDEPVEAGAGSMFGHASLMGDAPSEVGVRAIANMIVLRLPATRFATVAMQHAGLLANMSDLPPLADVTL